MTKAQTLMIFAYLISFPFWVCDYDAGPSFITGSSPTLTNSNNDRIDIKFTKIRAGNRGPHDSADLRGHGAEAHRR